MHLLESITDPAADAPSPSRPAPTTLSDRLAAAAGCADVALPGLQPAVLAALALPPERCRCQALTKAGQPCRNFALPGSDYCRAHARLAAG